MPFPPRKAPKTGGRATLVGALFAQIHRPIGPGGDAAGVHRLDQARVAEAAQGDLAGMGDIGAITRAHLGEGFLILA